MPIHLGDICELKYGKSLKKENRLGGNVPVYGSNGIVGYHNQSLVNNPTVIVGRKGSIGEVHLEDGPSWPIDTTYYVKFKENEVHLNWFYRLLKTLRLNKLNRSAAIPGLNRNDFYRIKVKLPPLNDQIRIATLLSRIEALIATRKNNLKQLDDFLKSIFLEMFGPTNDGYRSWPLVEIKDLAEKRKGAMRTGPFGSNLKHDEFSEVGDVAVLGIDNAVQNRFSWGAKRFITQEKYEGLKQYRVYPGDVIITIMGTIGRTAVIPENIAVGNKYEALSGYFPR